ncbi:Putative FAD/NAD(P)-binding domain superfamily [Septoria linicola]|uniref:FAD/NAD(P)-binding domain superfamily n=1 Tax=Septoria linicola TaxID=215465 RepID=A0A9Q9ALG5_9PEZI|nr:putative FAD/NAD(P)-binding domain superfamily [Septoria linicola]USW50214.1 Putative FAD/NAD(P)-binding domain superfamily [Septoria linicola]
MEHVFNQYFFIFFAGSPQQEAVRTMFGDIMRQKLGGDTELAQKLMPDFPVGCRRITPGDGYLDALNAENVTARFDPIVKFTGKGILTQPPPDTGPEETESNLIICATGFDVIFKPAWPMVGLNGTSLRKLWKEESEAYMGIAAPQMPNYFIFTGPNSPLGHGSLFGALEASSDYILKWCSKIASQGIKSITVKPEVVREFNDYSQEFLRRLCEHLDVAHGTRTTRSMGAYLNQQNRFGFMGSGITDLEASGGQLGFYLDK